MRTLLMLVAFVFPAVAAALIALLQARANSGQGMPASLNVATLWAIRVRALAAPTIGGAVVAVIAWWLLRDTVHGFDATAPLAGLAPWAVGLIYFLAMIVGMLCQALFDAIKARKTGQPPVIDRWQLVLPLLISPMVFGGIYSQLPSTPEVKLLSLILCFQNGFFWQDLMASITAKSAAH